MDLHVMFDAPRTTVFVGPRMIGMSTVRYGDTYDPILGLAIAAIKAEHSFSFLEEATQTVWYRHFNMPDAALLPLMRARESYRVQAERRPQFKHLIVEGLGKWLVQQWTKEAV